MTVANRQAFDVYSGGDRQGFVVELPDLQDRHRNEWVACVWTNELGTDRTQFVGHFARISDAVEAIIEADR